MSPCPFFGYSGADLELPPVKTYLLGHSAIFIANSILDGRVQVYNTGSMKEDLDVVISEAFGLR